MSPAEIKDDMLAEFVQDLAYARCASAASLALVLYDYSITIATEIRYMWKREGTLGTCLYLLLRYLGILTTGLQAIVLFRLDLTPEVCHGYLYAQGILIESVISLSQITLIIRLYAVYNRSRYILLFFTAIGFSS
ncbi:hypothetical protein M422DRAFT_784854, partial [Sphaerobolus stellatus SS14]